jgi:hypothetical protein
MASTPKTKSTDTGLRVKPEGTIYVDRKVFYARQKVRDTIVKMSESSAYPKAASRSK